MNAYDKAKRIYDFWLDEQYKYLADVDRDECAVDSAYPTRREIRIKREARNRITEQGTFSIEFRSVLEGA